MYWTRRILAAVAALMLFAFAGCVCPWTSSAEANKAVICRLNDEGLNPGRVEVVDELMTENPVLHGMPSGYPPGREGFKQLIRMHHTAFSDFRCTTEDIFAAGDRVVNRWSWTGKHTGEHMGIKPTGKPCTLTGISIHRLEEGRIAEQWHETDSLGLLRQLGALPQSPGKD